MQNARCPKARLRAKDPTRTGDIRRKKKKGDKEIHIKEWCARRKENVMRGDRAEIEKLLLEQEVSVSKETSR